MENLRFKFRAWHKADEKMYEVYGFAQNKWFLKGKQFPMPNGAVVIMQYTGLKDRNGKEIYEGDIILFNNFGDTLDKVVYSPGCFHTSGGGYLLDEIREIEVIGNIYENPELLEEKRTLSKRWFTE